MRHRIAIALVVVTLSACGAFSNAPPTGSAVSTSVASGTPVIDCLGGIDPSTCDRAVKVTLAAVDSAGWTPTRVWINSGLLAPITNLLFDPSANFPVPNPPIGGRWIGNAEVAFAETDKHAGINLAAVGPDLKAVLIDYRVPLSAWCSGTCPSAAATEGAFRLELVLPHLDWKASDAITGTAILSFDGSAPTTIYGSDLSVIVFSYAEVGGRRKVDPVWISDCAGRPLDPATPLNADLSKSGAMPNSGPDADFLRSFLTGPDVRLPAGTWDITALATFTEGDGCVGVEHSMKATVRITVWN
jgi:hypothetical protein